MEFKVNLNVVFGAMLLVMLGILSWIILKLEPILLDGEPFVLKHPQNETQHLVTMSADGKLLLDMQALMKEWDRQRKSEVMKKSVK